MGLEIDQMYPFWLEGELICTFVSCAIRLSLTFMLIDHVYSVLETEVLALLRQVFDVIQNEIYGYLSRYVPWQWLMDLEDIPRKKNLWITKNKSIRHIKNLISSFLIHWVSQTFKEEYFWNESKLYSQAEVIIYINIYADLVEKSSSLDSFSFQGSSHLCYDHLNQWKAFGECITRHLVIQRNCMGRNKRKCQSERPFGHSKWFLPISVQALQKRTFGKISGIACNPTVYCWHCGWSWHFCSSLPWLNLRQEPSPM